MSLRKRINIYKVCLLAAYPPVANLTCLPAMAMYFARKELGATAGLGGEPTHAPFTDLLRLEADTIDFALTGGPRVKSFVLHNLFLELIYFLYFLAGTRILVSAPDVVEHLLLVLQVVCTEASLNWKQLSVGQSGSVYLQSENP